MNPPSAASAELARQWVAAREAAVVARASDLAVVTIDGDDAEKFLQGQLSNDVAALAPAEGQWTSYNSPKGRMLATLYLYRLPAGGSPSYAAILAGDVAASVAKRLAMFVLRSNVKVGDASSSTEVFGVGGPAASSAVRRALGGSPDAGRVAVQRGLVIVHLPDGRVLIVTPRADAASTFALLSAHAQPVEAPVWEWLRVRSGVPLVTSVTQDLFVAQMANWDAIGGLDFKKGCYTGQEIVARMQYLGRLKERLFLFEGDIEPPAPGTRLYSNAFGDQASGTVVNSAPTPQGGSAFLAVVQRAAVEAGPVAIGSPDGTRVTAGRLPYPLPEPVAPRKRL
jgi:tRNA-modifying protein YgfZ